MVSKVRRRRRKGGLLRALRWLAFVPVASRVPMYARLVWSLVLDERVPMSRKAVLVGAAGYILVGRDLMPDEIPVLGGLDDLAVVVLAVEVFFDGISDDLLEEKLDELCIDKDAFRRDIDQVRHLTPAPVRSIIHRLPDAIEAVGHLVKTSKIGPRLRSRIVKEESFA
ncbi:MAG TPA: DUF1232 domain-containing protein [Candidatus Limnocylindrales bacterium]|jgi:uncharacterized membrane protein YkvA (DUF1232 family)